MVSGCREAKNSSLCSYMWLALKEKYSRTNILISPSWFICRTISEHWNTAEINRSWSSCLKARGRPMTEVTNCMLPVNAFRVVSKHNTAYSSSSHGACTLINSFIRNVQESRLSDCNLPRIYMNILANYRQVFCHSGNKLIRPAHSDISIYYPATIQYLTHTAQRCIPPVDSRMLAKSRVSLIVGR